MQEVLSCLTKLLQYHYSPLEIVTLALVSTSNQSQKREVIPNEALIMQSSYAYLHFIL